jgi:molybdopterin molybdotransferase
MIPIGEALDIVLAAAHRLPAEEVGLLAALGRAAAAPVLSRDQVPAFDNSAMDGYALRGADLLAGRRQFVVTLDVPAGRWISDEVGEGEAARIMTGAPLPPGADTVVPVEHTERQGEIVVLSKAPAPGANVRLAGEDVMPGDSILLSGASIGPAEVGLLAAAGLPSVAVARRPRVAILATGSELVPAGEPLAPGQIHDTNSLTEYAQVLAAGAEPVLLGIAPDDPEATRRLLAGALDYDVVVTSGGVSVGDYDFVKQVQAELGVERKFWGVACKPGKPLAFGTRGGTLVFGVPGNPVAAIVSFELFIRPALLALQGRADLYRPYVWATADELLRPAAGRTELRRCRLRHRGHGWSFVTTGVQGSAMLHSMAGADGLAITPAGHPGGEPGEELAVLLLEGSSVERPPLD